MQLVWALRLLLLYLTQSVVCRYIGYDTKSRPAFNIGGDNERSFHSPYSWHHQYNGYPWRRIAFPFSRTLPNVYFTDEPQQLSDHFSSPFLTKLRYYYTGSEYNLPNFVVRPIVFEPILYDSSCLDETDKLSSTENAVVPVSDDHSDKNYIYESNAVLTSADKFDKPDIINELQHFPLKGPLNENSLHNPGETNFSHFSPVTTESSSEFSATTEGSNSQKSTSNNSPGNSHILLDSEIVNFGNSLVDNASSEDSNSEVQANESALESSKPSTVFPLNTSEYSSDTTASTHPTEIQLFVLVGLTENDGNVSHIAPVLNSSNSEEASITPKYPDQIFHLNVATGKLNPKELKGIETQTTEISISATSAIDLPNEIVEPNEIVNVIAEIVNSTVLEDGLTLEKPSPTEETNTSEGSELISQQMFNNNKIGEEQNDTVLNYENVNLFSKNLTTSFSPVEITNAENLVTQEYVNVEPTESTLIATHANILPTEVSTLIPLQDSEAGNNVFIEEGVVQLLTIDTTTNVHAEDHSSESTLLTSSYFSEPNTTEIPDLSTLYVGETSVSEPNDILPVDSTTASSESESLNATNYVEDATVSQNPQLVLNVSLNITSLSEELNTTENLILNTHPFDYLLMTNGSIETNTEKLGTENSNVTIDAGEQNNKFHETENISSVLTSDILLTSPSHSEDESISEQQAPTTQHSFNISEATESNDQLTSSESPIYSSTTNFPLQITNSENWVNPTTEINSNFSPSQELNKEVNESGNLIVTTSPLITNTDDTNIYFPTNYMNEIATDSSVIKTQESLTDIHESEDDSIIFPYDHFLPEEDYTRHNISFLDSNGNMEPLNYLDKFENISSINIEDTYNNVSSNIPESYQNVMENGENINGDGVDSLVTQHQSINNTEKEKENSRNEFAEIGQDENLSEPQDDYTVSSKMDIIVSTSEKTFLSTSDPEKTSLPGDTIAISSQHDNSFNKNEDNPSDGSSFFTTPSYSDFENGNIYFPQFSENVSNEDKKYNYPVVTSISLSYDKVNEDIGSQLSMTTSENKYEFSQNENKHEAVNSHSELYMPTYSAIGTDNSLSLLHGDEKYTTENINQEKSESNIYKEEESNSQNHNQGISEIKEDVDSAQIIDKPSFHHETTEDPSEVTFTSDGLPDYIYETEPSSYSFGGSLTELGDDFSDSFYGLKFPEITEPSHSLKKYLPPTKDNIKEIASSADDSVNPPPYFEGSSENSNAQEKENGYPSDSQKALTDIYYFEESPETLDEDVYSASQEDYVYEDSTLPQENKELPTYNNFGSNSLPNSLKYIPQNTVGGFHRSDIPIEDEFSHDDPSSKGLLQRRKRRQATLSQASTKKPEAKLKLPSDDFTAIPHEFTKGLNEKVAYSREKRTFGQIPLLSIFHKKPEFFGFYKGKLIKNGILRPLLHKKLNFLHKKLFLTSFLAGLLDSHDSGHYKRSIRMKPTPAPHPCDPCDPHTKSIDSSESRESVEDDYSYSDDEYDYFDEKALEGADRSDEIKATPVYDDSDTSITDFISKLPSFEGHYSD